MSLVNNKMGPCLKVEHLQKLLKVNFDILMNSVGTTNGSCSSHVTYRPNSLFQDRLSPAQARLLSLKKWFGTDFNKSWFCMLVTQLGFISAPMSFWVLWRDIWLEQQSVDVPDCEICASHQPVSLNTCKNQWLCKLIYPRILNNIVNLNDRNILCCWVWHMLYCCDKFAKWGWNWTLTL